MLVSRALAERRLAWGVALLAALLAALVAWGAKWPAPREVLDERQSRRDVAAPLPQPGTELLQTFVPQHDNLSAIQVMVVRWSGESAAGDEKPILRLELLDESGGVIRAASWDSELLGHDRPLRWRFELVPDSAGRALALRVTGNAANHVGVWAFSLDGYPRGELRVNGAAGGGDLAFESRYQLPWPAALRSLADALRRDGGLLALALVLLLVPGLAIMPRAPGRRVDGGTRLSLALAGSVALVPLGWLWLTEAGGRWRGLSLWLSLGAALAVTLWRWRKSRRRLHITPESALLGVILAASLAVRLLAVRDLALPSWVDSPQHYLISRMMAESGQTLAGYRPWMPVDRFWYHMGYHALAASLHLLSGQPLERVMLAGGQLLNALAPLSVYGGVVLLTGRRRAGLLAAALVALLTIFPAYYLTWGRYTQLAGMLVLPPLAGLLYRMLERIAAQHGGRPGGAVLWLMAALGGLFLVHARVWVYGMVWLAVATAAAGRARYRPGHSGRLLRWALLLPGGMLAAALPWFVRVGQEVLAPRMQQFGVIEDPGSYNAIPWGYLRYGWEPVWLVLAGLALLAAVGIWLVGRERGRSRAPLLLGGWVAALLLVVNASRLGVPTAGLVNNNTLVISLYFPVAALAGWLLDAGLELAARRRWSYLAGAAVLGAAGMAGCLYGVPQQVFVVNQETVLARPDDMALLEWAGRELPPDALVAVNSWLWLPPANWAGWDAGYWLLPLSGRETTMPPIGYGLDAGYRQRVNEANAAMQAVSDWSSSAAAGLLRDLGVTHVLVGERGGFFKPEQLARNPELTLVRSNGAAWLFEVKIEP